MAKKLSNMKDDEFMEAWESLGERVQKDKDRLREFSQEHQRRNRVKMLKLEPGDLELLQSMTPEGIESQEAVMTGEDPE